MTLKTVAIAALLATAVAAPGNAQSLTDLVRPKNGQAPAAAAKPAEPPAEQAEESSGASGLPLGTALEDGGVAVGEAYRRGVFSEWALTCVKTGREAEPCRLEQNLKGSNDQAVARIELFPVNDANAAVGAAVLAPLGTLLPRGVRMQIDDGEVKGYQFIVCNAQTCIAEFGLTQEEVDAMKRGNEAVIQIVAAAEADTPVRLKVSLEGFTKAFGEFTELTEGLF